MALPNRAVRFRLTTYQFTYWLEDNGITTAEFERVTGITHRTAVKWRRPSLGYHRLPAWVVAFITFWHRDLTRHIGPRPICRCGCGGRTVKSHITGCYSLYLPEHSPAFRRRRLHTRTWRLPYPPTDCPGCHIPLKHGAFQVGKDNVRYIHGSVCTRCGFRYLGREAS